MSLAIKVQVEPLRSLDYTLITNAYVGVGTETSYSSRMIYVQNFTDASLMFSFDAIHDHFAMAPNSFLLLDFASNKTIETGYFLAKGSRLYVKEIGVPADGTVYLTVFYGIDY